MNSILRTTIFSGLAVLLGGLLYYVVLSGSDTVEERPVKKAGKVWPAGDSLFLSALMSQVWDGRDLAIGRVLDRNNFYTRYYMTYRSESLRISGIMNVPHGRGPFPVVVLNHGYIPPSIYTNGRGLKREQDFLARRGYVVIHPDYRNHAQSDKDTTNDFRFRDGYTKDVINSIHAVKESELPFLDKDHIGMMGHSMGGGIAMNTMVIVPDMVQAVVLYAPVSGDVQDNFRRWGMSSPIGAHVVKTFGRPEENPDFWSKLSAMYYFPKAKCPVLIHHGTDDESCPVEWSDRIADSLKSAGKSVALYKYERERHELINQWPLMMERTAAFFDRHLKKQEP